MKYLFPFVFLFASCSSELKKPDAPGDLVGRDTMVLIFKDLVVLESHIQSKYQNIQNYHKLMEATGDNTLKRLHVSPKRFERSYDYYVSRQTELQSIYSEVLDSLNKEVNELKAKRGKDDPEVGADTTANVLQPFRQP